MKLKSNCKINLNLRIIGIKDGYHMLESVFCPINLCDYIEIDVNSEDMIVGMDIPIEENIMYKALKIIKKKYNIDKCVKISIEKHIPMQAGLGGGSSNAAFVIKALNKLFNLNLSESELLDIAKEIGSDVPFFIINKPAFVEGRGERITPIDNFNKIFGVLIFDDMYMSTKQVFQIYDECCLGDEKNYENDLERAVCKISGGDKINEIKNVLYASGCYKALMSGAGGSVFGLCNENELLNVYNKVKEKYNKVWMFESI